VCATCSPRRTPSRPPTHLWLSVSMPTPTHAPSSPAFLIALTSNVSPADPNSFRQPTWVVSTPPALVRITTARDVTPLKRAAFSGMRLPSVSNVSSTSWVAGSASASAKPREGRLTNRRTCRGSAPGSAPAASAPGPARDSPVSRTAWLNGMLRSSCSSQSDSVNRRASSRGPCGGKKESGADEVVNGARRSARAAASAPPSPRCRPFRDSPA